MGIKACICKAVILWLLAFINVSRGELDLENLVTNENNHFKTLWVIVFVCS